MKLTQSRQSGFTLVEIAIVLVIIGILLAGVLKGQSMINNGRIKGLVNNMNAVSSSYNGYIDRYQATPGTEPLATFAARGWPNTLTGTSPLNLASLPYATTFATAGDQTVFWQSIKSAGFFAGAGSDVVNPPTATGGLMGIAYSPYGMQGVSVCISGVNPQIAAGVDIVLDGPISTTTNSGNSIGSLRGNVGAANPLAPAAAVPAAVAYNENNAVTWTLCRTL